MTAPEGRRRVIVFIHGVRNDDPSAQWRRALDAAFAREGTEGLEGRGYSVIAPSYLRYLEAQTLPEVDEPPMTYVKGPEHIHDEAARKYWSALAALERTGIRGHVSQPRIDGKLPTDAAAEALMPRLFNDAVSYRKSRDRRHAIYQCVLEAIPPGADVVIIAHSLGSVVAADLLYHLPLGSRLRMLITLGSPLGLKPLQEHLNRRSHRFPYEVTGPWINIVGTRDAVTGFRGLSRYFPEALDVFVDTGTQPRSAHAASTYLDHPTVARAIHWLDGVDNDDVHEAKGNETLPDVLLPDALLSVLVGAQFALRLEQAQDGGDQRSRFGQARLLVIESLADRLADAGHDDPVLRRLALDHGPFLEGRFSQAALVNFLLTAWTANPVMPYEIEVSKHCRRVALQRLATDLGVPSVWADTVTDAEEKARDAHGGGWTWKRSALAVAGAAAIVAAPVLVLAAAPAGLAGGAAIVAGLSALGPGGMLGGVGIVSLLGGAGGALAAQALISGSAAQVEETVIHLQALAKASKELSVASPGNPSWSALIAMEDAITDEHARLALFSDPEADAVKELEKKRESVHRGIEWLKKHTLDPPGLPPGGD